MNQLTATPGTGTALPAVDWSLWSTTARIVLTDASALAEARRVADALLDEVERAVSRFRPDSEVMLLAASGASEADLSQVLTEYLSEALYAARWTDGAVDPTVGNTLSDLGYDRDLTAARTHLAQLQLDLSGPRPVARVRRTPGWQSLKLTGNHLSLPAGLVIDLGATAKAVAADRCAAAIAARFGCGVLVSLGGDIATAGTGPESGWLIEVRDTAEDPGTALNLPSGAAVATSSTVRRTWRHGDTERHHILDPQTARPAESPWRSVTVVAHTCAVANAASTATIAKGATGADWLRTHDLPARLVDRDRRVHHLGGWQEENAA